MHDMVGWGGVWYSTEDIIHEAELYETMIHLFI